MDETRDLAASRLPLIPGYGPADLPEFDDPGDEAIVLAERPADLDPEARFERLLAVCTSWTRLADPDAMTGWLTDAVPLLELEYLIDFNNIVLTLPNALTSLADTLVVVWGSISTDDAGSRGNVALEGWTRLALGGWAPNLPVRAALGARAAAVAKAQAEADSFLVRTLGAVLDQWPDVETRQSLERLAAVEELECDVAFELGMNLLRQAVSITDITGAAAAFTEAHDMFTRAHLEGERPDATAFATAAVAVAAFLDGQPVPAETVETIRAAVAKWHLGYLGLVPEWRQARAQTAGAWATLISDLAGIADLDEPWLNAAQVLADVGHLYSARNGLILVPDPVTFPTWFGNTVGLPEEPEATEVIHATGLPVAVSPRLDAALARTAETVQLVDRWLEAMTDRLPQTVSQDTIEAIQQARERIRSRPPPGKADASRDSRLPPEIREALEQHLDQDTLTLIEGSLAPLLATADDSLHTEAIRLAATTAEPTPLAEELLLNNLASQLVAVLPEEFEIWRPHLVRLLGPVIRVVAIAIDREQGGTRSLPWHRDPSEGNAPEAELADYLCLAIQLTTGHRCYVEVNNTGGGRADVVIPIGAEQFVIEVKRITARRTNEALTSEYGPQAAEYTKTGAPFAFLGVLDLTRHTSRLDLNDSFWVDVWSDKSGRRRALTGLRVLANVAPPSSAS